MRYYGTFVGTSLFPAIISLMPVFILGGFLGYFGAASDEDKGRRLFPRFVFAESLAIFIWLGCWAVDLATNRVGSVFVGCALLALMMFGLPAFLFSLAVGAALGWWRSRD